MKYKVRVYHASYGCETGCCGHYVEISNDKKTMEMFNFRHPYGDDFKIFAFELAREIISKRFPECVDSIDWDSLEFGEVFDNC